ncbi:cytochrome P450 9e2 [Folsomia candida]|uniref:Cytochrome P450 9e2 n=1 Tax=Folsomia candida TaxID=158441 RepID=A0A226D481_FOLCA|nr:cytochrome P450 9e2 [Folsomia candida]OXA40039.1 Cytochrome P450 9e2 [Folsomia candida]
MELATYLSILLFLAIFLISYVIYSLISEILFFRSKKILHLGNSYLTAFYYMTFKSKSMWELVHVAYTKTRQANVPIAGNFEMGLVNYFIPDLTILKHILVKDFDHFVNRRAITIPKSDLLTKKMLFFMYDEPWKALRSKLSPTFTTGKIKRFFALFNASAKKLVDYIDAQTEGEVDLVAAYSKFTTDTIASAVCGMDSCAFEQKEHSVFERMGQKLQFSFNLGMITRFVVMSCFPGIAERGMTIFGDEVSAFFGGGIKSLIRERTQTGRKGNDFIQLMMEARENKLAKTEDSELESFERDAVIKGEVKGQVADLLDDDGIVSNCVLFIVAGYDTTQSLLLFCAYALAIHPEIQDKLRTVVDEGLEESGGDFTYEGINQMTYLDMVINETLRFYPPAPTMDRRCTQDYAVPGTDVVIKKGDGIMVPVLGIHHDERYYSEPEKFDPERFSPENKGKINQYAFLPFGQGPRNCIGMRFALMEVKLAIAQLVHNFDIEPSKRTPIPMEYQNAGSLMPKGGMWLSLKRRPGTLQD